MNGRSKNEREERALDALFVSQLRWNDAEDIDEEHLPRLTDEDKAALDSLGPDFMQRLLAGKVAPSEAPDESEEEPVYADEGMLAGMNRADNIDDETAEELERKRREIIARVKREEVEEQDNAD